MSEGVCATLSAVFPLILIAVIAQRPTLHPNLRRSRPYRASVRLAIVCSLAGLVAVIVGQELGGFSGPMAVPIWMLFALDVASLGFTILAASATHELEEDQDPTSD